MSAAHRRPRGFSLLEVLVTVTIFALLFAVLMSGWYQAMRAQAQLDDAAQRLQRQQQLSQLFRRLVAESLNPSYNAGTKFKGDEKGFTAESSAAPALGIGAAPNTYELRLETANTLRQLSIRAGAAATATRYPWQFAQATLTYFDPQGRSSDIWPPAFASSQPIEGSPSLQLPALVQLTIRFEGEDEPLTLLAAPRASTWDLSEPSPPMMGGVSP